jgi:hypothetical protein
LRCPLQYYFERVLKLPRRTISDAQVLGLSVHSAIAVYHRKIMAGEPVLPHHIYEAFLSAWESQTSRTDVVVVNEKSVEESHAQGIALLELYLKEPPQEQIQTIEQPLIVPITTSDGTVLEKPLLVIPDLISRQGDQIKVHEMKTSGRAYSESEVAMSLQPTCYGHAVCELTGEDPIVEFTVLIKTKNPRLQKIEAPRNSADYQRLGDLIAMVEKATDSGIFYPIESPINCCSCAYFRSCREWTATQECTESPILRAEAIPC